MEIWTLCYFLYNEWHSGLVGGRGVPPIKKPCGDLLKLIAYINDRSKKLAAHVLLIGGIG